MDDPELMPQTDIHVQEVLLAASQHDLTTLRHLLRAYNFPDVDAVDVQDPETGFCPLHAAIAACETEEESVDAHTDGETQENVANGYTAATNGMSLQEELVEGAAETVKCLLQNGAIWNQLDKNSETPGCIALRLKLKELYELMVDAGVRAELLLNRLEGYTQLEDDGDEEDKDDETTQINGVNGVNGEQHKDDQDQDQGDDILDVNSTQYLSSALTLTADRLLDGQQNGVMMSWESEIMARSANEILPRHDLRILNVGFGMGIIDTHIQSKANKPSAHHIIEAHPTVVSDMKAKGWHEKPGVVIHEGKWQDVIPQLIAAGEMFDAIYFDTFAESYSQFRDFLSEQVIGLLDPAGKWSYFNGMGADRQISYDVYQKVVEMDLFESGFDVDWHDVELPELDGEWEGVKRKYWNVENYRLPVCRFMD